jgi:putative membrane protein
MSTMSVLAVFWPRGLIVGVLLPVAIVALVAYGAYELIRSSGPSGLATGVAAGGQPPAPSSSALSILDERFARGEIDAEEYVQRRGLLATGAAGQATATATASVDGDPPPQGATVEQPAVDPDEPDRAG